MPQGRGSNRKHPQRKKAEREVRGVIREVEEWEGEYTLLSALIHEREIRTGVRTPKRSHQIAGDAIRRGRGAKEVFKAVFGDAPH